MSTLFIILVLVILAIITLNAILIKESIERELTFSEIIAEDQDTRLGRILMILLTIPTLIILSVKSLLPVNTQSCFDDDAFDCYYEDEVSDND
jgi:hypothetical protein